MVTSCRLGLHFIVAKMLLCLVIVAKRGFVAGEGTMLVGPTSCRLGLHFIVAKMLLCLVSHEGPLSTVVAVLLLLLLLTTTTTIGAA